MAINTTTLESTLQSKFNTVTDPKEMLLLGKAYEATVGGIGVSDIENAADTGVADVNSAKSSAVSAINSEMGLSGKINQLMNTKFNPGGGGAYRSMFVIDRDGRVCGWGSDNDNHQAHGRGLDHIGGMHPLSFRQGATVPGKFIQVEAVSYTGMALDENGKVWTWGYTGHGQRGVGNTSNRQHGSMANIPTTVKQIAIGKSHHNGNSTMMMALDTNGDVWTWGYNSHSQCGRNGTSNNSSTYTPQKILDGQNVKHIYNCGSHAGHAGAITHDGDAYMWGYNGYGNCGVGTTSTVSSPVKINGIGQMPSSANVVHMQLTTHGHNGSAWVTSDGKLYMAGYNGHGQLGVGNTSQQTTPRLHNWFNGSSADRRVKIDTAENKGFYGENKGAYIWIAQNNSQWATFALSESNKLYGWGHNGHGRLGNGNTSHTSSGSPYQTLSGDIVHVAMGGYDGHENSIALFADGTVKACGYNGNYPLCMDDEISDTSRRSWREMHLPSQMNGQIDMVHFSGTTSEGLSVFRTTDGTVWCAGYGGEYQTGIYTASTMGGMHRPHNL